MAKVPPIDLRRIFTILPLPPTGEEFDPTSVLAFLVVVATDASTEFYAPLEASLNLL